MIVVTVTKVAIDIVIHNTFITTCQPNSIDYIHTYSLASYIGMYKCTYAPTCMAHMYRIY